MLHVLCSRGQVDTVSVLLRQGVPVNALNKVVVSPSDLLPVHSSLIHDEVYVYMHGLYICMWEIKNFGLFQVYVYRMCHSSATSNYNGYVSCSRMVTRR